MFDSLRARLTTGFLLVVVIPMVLLAVLAGYRAAVSLETQSLDFQHEIARRVGDELASFIDHRVQELLILDELVGLATLDTAAQKVTLQKLLLTEPAYQELTLLDGLGREQIRLSRTDVVLPAQLGDRRETEEFVFPIGKGGVYYGPVRFDPRLGEPLMCVSVPIVERLTGVIHKVLVAEIRFKKIWNLLAETHLPSSVDVYVLSAGGQVVAHKNPAVVLRGTTIGLPRDGNRTTGPEGQEVIVVKRRLKLGESWLTVVAMQPVSVALGLARRTVSLIAAITALSLIGAVVAAVLLARRIVLPIEALASTAGLVSQGYLSAKFEAGGRGEVGQLGSALRQMSIRLSTTITTLERSEFAERARALVTLESIGDAVMTTDAKANVQYLNPVAEWLTGWSLQEARGQPARTVFEIVDEETDERVADPIAGCLAEAKVTGLGDQAILVNRRGRRVPIQDSIAPIRDREGEILGVVVVFSDASERRRLQREISYQARHDALTGLVNRREFERRLQRVFETARAEGSEHVLCYLDLDRFKAVNDTCGHAAGDELLRQVSVLFREKVRKRDTLGRLGGDEFGLLMEYCSSAQASRAASELRRAVEEFRFAWGARSLRVGVSIGLVCIDPKSESAGVVLRSADRACYVAKAAGGNGIHVYAESDEELAKRSPEAEWAGGVDRV